MSTLSVLGLGDMGHALAAAATTAGHRVTVWNRTPGRADGLDVAVAPDPAAALRASDVALLVLLDTASVLAVLDRAGDAVAGRVVVNLTTTDPDDARRVADRVTAAGGRALDGGIMAVPAMVGGPDALVLYSGDRAAFDTAAPTLAALGATRFVGADAGAASLYDFALLSAMYGMFAGAEHALALLRASGAPEDGFVEDLMRPWLTATMTTLGEPDADAGSGAAMQLSGVRQMLATSRRRGVDAPLEGHLHSAVHTLERAG